MNVKVESLGYSPADSPGDYLKCPVKLIPSLSHSPKGEMITINSSNFDAKLRRIKAGSHCSTDVVISMRVGRTFQKIATKRLFTIERRWIELILKRTEEIQIIKRPLKLNVLKYFKENDIFKKRGLCKCSSIVHGLAIVEKEAEIMLDKTKSDKALNNKLSNFQRVDRSAGIQLIKGFLSNHGLHCTLEDEIIAQLTGYSFDVFNKLGYLELSTESIKDKNVVFYHCGKQLYLVKKKYVNAFGNIYRSKRSKQYPASCTNNKCIKLEDIEMK